MQFMWEFIVGMVFLSPVFALVYIGNKDRDEFTRNYFKMLRDQQKAIKGEYDKIDRDS